MTQASICTIGDEILIGQIVDTNSSHIARMLESAGIKVIGMSSIGDNHVQIVDTLRSELSKNDVVIVTGGLGPTKDDITKKALAELSGALSFRTDARQLEIVHKILSSRGLDILDINIAQASVPDTCEVIPNRLGTAPIMVFRFSEKEFGHKVSLYSLPGVPYEAIGSFKEVLEDIKINHSVSNIYHKTLMTFGIAESALSKLIEQWEDALPKGIHLAYLPNQFTGVKLRISGYGTDRETIEHEADKLKQILGELIYADHETTLQECIASLLKSSGKTLSIAESCTGGTIAQLITSISGSSEYFTGGVVSYANSVKTQVLGVSPEIIEKNGAVSSECVAAMAEGVYPETIDDNFIQMIVSAAPLHDIGKIAVPDYILQKAGKLTEKEFEIMKSHTIEGGRMVCRVIENTTDEEYIKVAYEIATYHHEKWNGEGYPKHLKGEEIPLSARIIATIFLPFEPFFLGTSLPLLASKSEISSVFCKLFL